jgi:DNA-binding NtrC family response regulator
MIKDDLDTLVQHLLDRGILFEDAQREFERMFIARALAKTNGNVVKAAKITGLHRNTLSRKISTYRIKRAG